MITVKKIKNDIADGGTHTMVDIDVRKFVKMGDIVSVRIGSGYSTYFGCLPSGMYFKVSYIHPKGLWCGIKSYAGCMYTLNAHDFVTGNAKVLDSQTVGICYATEILPRNVRVALVKLLGDCPPEDIENPVAKASALLRQEGCHGIANAIIGSSSMQRLVALAAWSGTSTDDRIPSPTNYFRVPVEGVCEQQY